MKANKTSGKRETIMESEAYTQIFRIRKNSLKIEESIRHAREMWEECLKEANGDLEKARRLYDEK